MEPNDTTNKYLLPIAVIVAGLFIGGAVIWSNHQGGTTPQTAHADITKVKIDGEPYIGDPNAPVTIAFWSDFQCPYCKQFETGGVPELAQITPAMPDLITNYVNTGKVKIVFLDFPFLGQDSITGAEYGRAVWKLYPDRYFDWRTAMYNAQDAEGDQGFGDAASIDKLNATIAGLDAAKIAADVKANAAAYDAQANADKAQATAQGVNATPSFVMGTTLLAGAYPYSNFQQALDPLLK